MKKITLSCILAGILLTSFLVLSPTNFDADIMPDEAIDNDTEETDSSVVYPFFGVDFGIQ